MEPSSLRLQDNKFMQYIDCFIVEFTDLTPKPFIDLGNGASKILTCHVDRNSVCVCVYQTSSGNPHFNSSSSGVRSEIRRTNSTVKASMGEGKGSLFSGNSSLDSQQVNLRSDSRRVLIY